MPYLTPPLLHKVLARPPNAVAALKDAMMRKVPPRLAMMKVRSPIQPLASTATIYHHPPTQAKQAVGGMGKLFA